MRPNRLLRPFSLILDIFQIKARTIILWQYIESADISISNDQFCERRCNKKDVRQQLRSGSSDDYSNDEDSIAESDEDLPYEVDEDTKFIVVKWKYNTYNKRKYTRKEFS